MKTKKKFKKHFIMVAVFGSMFFLSGNSSQAVPPGTVAEVISGIIDPNILYCRCKHGGCYGGNAISFRAGCAKISGTGNCTEHSINCPPSI